MNNSKQESKNELKVISKIEVNTKPLVHSLSVTFVNLRDTLTTFPNHSPSFPLKRERF